MAMFVFFLEHIIVRKLRGKPYRSLSLSLSLPPFSAPPPPPLFVSPLHSTSSGPHSHQWGARSNQIEEELHELEALKSTPNTGVEKSLEFERSARDCCAHTREKGIEFLHIPGRAAQYDCLVASAI